MKAIAVFWAVLLLAGCASLAVGGIDGYQAALEPYVQRWGPWDALRVEVSRLHEAGRVIAVWATPAGSLEHGVCLEYSHAGGWRVVDER